MYQNYKIYAKRTEIVSTIISARNIAEALEIAENMDGEHFEEVDGTLEFEIEDDTVEITEEEGI